MSLQLLQNCLMLINTILVEQTIEREGVWERLSAKIFEHRHRCFTDTSIPMDSLPSTSTVRHFSRLPDHLQTASKQMAARLASSSPVRNSIAPYRSVPPVGPYIMPCMHSFGSMTPRFLTISNLPLFAWAMYMFIRR